MKMHSPFLSIAILFAGSMFRVSQGFVIPSKTSILESQRLRSDCSSCWKQKSGVVIRLASSGTPDEDDDWETAEEASTNAKVLRFLDKKYPIFSKLLVKPNDEFIKELRENPSNTIFVVSDEGMEKLGPKKLAQLEDPRNLEIVTKTSSYHIIVGEALSSAQIQTEDWTKGRPKDGSKPNTLIAAIVTQSGEVPVGRSKSGAGFLGIGGGKEDGEIVIGPSAKLVQSFKVENCLIHEMDGLISPLQLWRYADQLRIPGF